MRVHKYTDQLPDFNKAVVTIGTFDGVHLGHRLILSQLKQEAAAIQGETVIITFHPHPRSIVHSGQGHVQLINSIEERIELLAGQGIDNVVIVPFTEEFSKLSAEQYVDHFLVERFHPHTVIIGYDHRFGNERKGDYHLLESYQEKGVFELKEISPHILNNVTVSSTRIRTALLEGDVATANSLLGYDFFFSGTVVTGDQLGRTLGYPTANISIPDPEKLIPGYGIYAVSVALMNDPSENLHYGMMSIGIRPTVNGTERTIEVNIFDFDKDIYGETIRVYLHHRIRDEEKFDGLDALKEQIARDEVTARKLLQKEN
jgi:riboflavin kinase / FMN adenylyltransferase